MELQDEQLMRNRFLDLARRADQKGIVTFSNFLNQNELHLFHQVTADIRTAYRLSGGYEFAERQMIAFIPDALYYDWDFPVVCLLFRPVNHKFAEELTHRDILGALMHLGVDRSRIGDIKLDGQNYFIFCEEGVADYLLQNLTKVRHTLVTGDRSQAAKHSIQQKFELLEGIVSSVRLDGIVAFLVRKSRSQSVLMIQSQKVFVNERIITSNAYECKAGDVISIRGFGKYIYEGIGGETKKGRIKIALQKYI